MPCVWWRRYCLRVSGTRQHLSRPTQIFKALKIVLTSYGALHLSQCTDCTDLLPLSNVNESFLWIPFIGCDPNRQQRCALVSLEGLEQLLQGEFEGDVTIRQNRQLSSLSEFSNLHTIRGDVTLEDNTKLSDLSGFENIQTITGDLTIAGNARLVTIESLRTLEHVGDLTITRNPILDSIAGLRNLRSVGDIYIRGDGIVSIENVGQHLDFDVQRTYDVVITDIACINDDGLEHVCFVNKLALTYQKEIRGITHDAQTVYRTVKRTLCVTTKVTACASVRTRTKSDRTVEVWVRYSSILVTQILSTM